MSLRKLVKYTCIYSSSASPQDRSYTPFIDKKLVDNLREQLTFWSAKGRPRSVTWKLGRVRKDLNSAQCRTLWRKQEFCDGSLGNFCTPATTLPTSAGQVMAPHSSLCKTCIIQGYLGALHCSSPFSKKGITSAHSKPIPAFHSDVVTPPCILPWILPHNMFCSPTCFFIYFMVFFSNWTL